MYFCDLKRFSDFAKHLFVFSLGEMNFFVLKSSIYLIFSGSPIEKGNLKFEKLSFDISKVLGFCSKIDNTKLMKKFIVGIFEIPFFYW